MAVCSHHRRLCSMTLATIYVFSTLCILCVFGNLSVPLSLSLSLSRPLNWWQFMFSFFSLSSAARISEIEIYWPSNEVLMLCCVMRTLTAAAGKVLGAMCAGSIFFHYVNDRSRWSLFCARSLTQQWTTTIYRRLFPSLSPSFHTRHHYRRSL